VNPDSDPDPVLRELRGRPKRKNNKYRRLEELQRCCEKSEWLFKKRKKKIRI